jgi:hypothetical protein
MSEQSMLGIEDDGEPPSSSREYNEIFVEHGVPFSDVYVSPAGIRVSVCGLDIHARFDGRAHDAYADLSYTEKNELVKESTVFMDEITRHSVGVVDADSRLLVNAAPLFFEPTRRAYLLGEREQDSRRLELTSVDILADHQRRILLGGLATFIWHLEKKMA